MLNSVDPGQTPVLELDGLCAFVFSIVIKVWICAALNMTQLSVTRLQRKNDKSRESARNCYLTLGIRIFCTPIRALRRFLLPIGCQARARPDSLCLSRCQGIRAWPDRSRQSADSPLNGVETLSGLSANMVADRLGNTLWPNQFCSERENTIAYSKTGIQTGCSGSRLSPGTSQSWWRLRQYQTDWNL